MIKIEPITPDLAEGLCRKITADLPEYFGLPEVKTSIMLLELALGSIWLHV